MRVVVPALRVGEPELDPGTGDRSAGPYGEHAAREDIAGPDLRAHRRVGLVEGAERVRRRRPADGPGLRSRRSAGGEGDQDAQDGDETRHP
jgi:hypothetical protein